jgi:hypothetical protein
MYFDLRMNYSFVKFGTAALYLSALHPVQIHTKYNYCFFLKKSNPTSAS